MLGGPDDTDPRASRVQLDLLRSASVGRRAQLTRSISSTAIELSKRAVAERMPGASREEALVRWVALAYGREIAGRLQAFLESRRR
jgi:hypothetical protein